MRRNLKGLGDRCVGRFNRSLLGRAILEVEVRRTTSVRLDIQHRMGWAIACRRTQPIRHTKGDS
jgi:hypothetical protein